MLSKYFQSMEKQISRYADDTRGLQKTREYCRRAEKYIKES